MTYKETIELLSNNLSTYFAEVYHSAEIVINDAGIKQPMVAKGDEWISLVPTDQRETVYIRRNGDDEIYEELKIGSCVKSYKMRSSLRVVFFKDHAKNHNEILSHLMQSVLVTGTKLKSIIQNKWKLLKDESSGDYAFGATTAYFAIDLYALWHLQPENCEEDFCVEVVNPLTCGPVLPSTTPGTPVPPVSEDCCILLQTNYEDNSRQDLLNLVDSDTATFEYLGDGAVTVHFNADSGEESGHPDDDWHILGNLLTVFGTHFLGTIDNVSLEFRTNNLRSGMIDISSLNAASPATLNNQTAFGQGALRLALAIGSTALGYRALYNLTTGDGNTAVGYEALMSNVTGVRQTAMGYKAGRLNTGIAFTAFGYLAGSQLTNSANMCAFGDSALGLYTGGADCTAIGVQALAQGSGINNTALGYAAMGEAINTGSHNTAVGKEAGLRNSGGSNNIFLGWLAGYFNTTESFRIAINSINCASVDREQNRSAFAALQNESTFYQLTGLNGRIGINNTAPTSYLHLTRGISQASGSPLKFVGPIVLTTTAGSATALTVGFKVTLTFATTTTHQFVLGTIITVAGVTPVAYNGDHVVTDCTATTVSWFSVTDPGAQTVAGTISQGAVNTVVENGAVEYDGTDYFASSGSTRYKLQRVGIVPASAGAAGVAGTIAYDSSFFYVCSATNTWVRAALSTW